MMYRRLVMWVSLVAAFSASALDSTAGEDLCRSEVFRDAFLEGQGEIYCSLTSPGPRLVHMGDEAVPCLALVARHGGDHVGIPACLEASLNCGAWALTALQYIGTPAARKALRVYAETGCNLQWRAMALRALGRLHDEASRPLFLESLEAGEPEVRASALLALGFQQREQDRDALLRAFARLPDKQLSLALHALRFYGDASLEPAAIARIEKVQDERDRAALKRSLAEWKQKREQEQALLEKILNPPDAEALFSTLHGVRQPNATVTAAAERWLTHADARVRAGAVALQARSPERSLGLVVLLEITEGLPDHVVVDIVARDLLQIPDAVVVSHLKARGKRMKYPATRARLERLLKHHAPRTPRR